MDFCSCKPFSFSRILPSSNANNILDRRACHSWSDAGFRLIAGRVACKQARVLLFHFHMSPSTVKLQSELNIKQIEKKSLQLNFFSWTIVKDFEKFETRKKSVKKVEFHTGFHIALHLKWQQASDLCGSISRGHWSLLLPRWSWHTTWRSRLHSLVH